MFLRALSAFKRNTQEQWTAAVFKVQGTPKSDKEE